MSDEIKKYQEIVQKRQELKKSLKELRAEFKDVAPKAFAHEAQNLFQKHEKLKSFGWTQYTPYWNDGDTCRFRANTDEPYINELCPWDFKDSELAEVGLTEADWHSISDDVAEFLSHYDKETLEDTFGDHAKITVKLKDDGTAETEVDEYDHD